MYLLYYRITFYLFLNINVSNLWPNSSSMVTIMYLYANLHTPILPPPLPVGLETNGLISLCLSVLMSKIRL